MVKMSGLLAMDEGLRERLCVLPDEEVYIRRVEIATRRGKIAYRLNFTGESSEHLGWNFAHSTTFANRWIRSLFRILVYQLYTIWIPTLLLAIAVIVLFGRIK